MPDLDDSNQTAGETGRFVWPPRGMPDEGTGEGPGDRSPTPAPAPVRVGLSAVEQFERVWLGMDARRFARQAALEGWAPDEPGAWCWRCGTGVGEFEVDGEGCASCRAKRLPWSRFVRIGAYEGVLRDAILALKLEGWRRTGADVGRMLGRSIARELEKAGVEPGRAELVPVPMSFRGRMRSGVDHTLVVARAASRVCGAPVRRRLRHVHGPGQAGLAASERVANVRGRFLARRGERVPTGVVTIVVDDIRTTGATLRECCKAVWSIREESARDPDRALVWAAAAGVTPERSRRAGVAPDGGMGGEGAKGAPGAGRPSVGGA